MSVERCPICGDPEFRRTRNIGDPILSCVHGHSWITTRDGRTFVTEKDYRDKLFRSGMVLDEETYLDFLMRGGTASDVITTDNYLKLWPVAEFEVGSLRVPLFLRTEPKFEAPRSCGGAGSCRGFVLDGPEGDDPGAARFRLPCRNSGSCPGWRPLSESVTCPGGTPPRV